MLIENIGGSFYADNIDVYNLDDNESYHRAPVEGFMNKSFITVVLSILITGTAFTARAQQQNLPEFEAFYDVYRSGIKIARTHRTFARQQDGRLLYRSETNVAGIASMFRKDRIIEQSIWQYVDGKVVPGKYLYEHTGTSRNRNVIIEFDWDKNQITNSINGEPWHMPASEGIQDKLLYQYSIMLDMQAGKSSLRYTIADGGKEKIYLFEKLGEEILETPLGNLKTIKMKRFRTDSDRISVFWSAPELGYLPVKLENLDDGEKTVAVIRSLAGYGFDRITQQ